MIILTNPSTLELVLGSSVTTSQLPYYIAYVDSTSTTHNPSQDTGVSNNTTIVTMLSTPVVATTRTIKYISIHNKDTTSKQIFIQINDTVNTRTLVDFTLDAGDRIEYTDTVGFRVISSLGEIKTVSTGNSITPASLTKVDDTNVTLTLGGSPTTALLQGTSLTLGWTGTLADSRIASAATWNAKQAPFTILSTLGALANASGVLTNNGAGVLSWGVGGGSQTPWTSNISAAGYTLFGNSTSGGTLTLASTSNATKGKILFGTSAYDEVNNCLGIKTTTPTSTAALHINYSGEQVRLQGDSGSIYFYRSNNINSQGSLSADAGNFRMVLSSVNGLRLSFWTDGVERMHISGTGATAGNVGIGTYTTGATARLELPAGAATASKAPLKFLSGTNLTTPENGAMEFDGTNLYFTTGGIRKTIQLI